MRPAARPEGGNGLADLLVFGAHLSGQPLNADLRGRGAILVGPVQTSTTYRLWALDTTPPKPGLVRVRSGGAAVRGEHWQLPVAAFGRLVATLPAPMTIGSVELADGRVLPGFLVEPCAIEGAPDITAFGGWAAYLDACRLGRSSMRSSRAATGTLSGQCRLDTQSSDDVRPSLRRPYLD